MNALLVCSALQLPHSAASSASLKPRNWGLQEGATTLHLIEFRNVDSQRTRALHESWIGKMLAPDKHLKIEKPGLPVFATAFALGILDVDAAFAAGDDPLCIGFAGNYTYTIIVVACVLQAVALIGAAVGGILARQRKLEVERINGQLRQIFAKMRRQYQVENYAPNLTYAPAVSAGRLQEAAPIPVDPTKQELMKRLKAGKKFLREKNPQAAYEEFAKSLTLAKELNDRVEQKKAARGLGASCQRQGKFRDAIDYHSMVLTISHLTGEHSGYTEALGAIADCYTELGDLENAAKFYDQYISRLDNED